VIQRFDAGKRGQTDHVFLARRQPFQKIWRAAIRPR
jgi:hypothetical protein